MSPTREEWEVAALANIKPPQSHAELMRYLGEPLGWKRVRQLVRDGEISRPECDEYYLGMLSYHIDCFRLVRDDPALLEHEIWPLFEIEGTQELSLADHDKYSRETWSDIFLGLAVVDPAARSRFLDASLAALERDFPAFKVGWFSRFHEALKPTPDERVARVAVYLRLLRSPIPATVSMSVAALKEVQKAGRLDGGQLLGHVAPALAARAAGTTGAALRLVDGAVRAEPKLAGRAALVATEALVHASADVQAAALTLIDRVAAGPDEDLAAALERRRDDVAASLRPRFEALAGRVAPVSRAGPIDGPVSPDRPEIAPAEQSSASSVPLDPFASLQPIQPIQTLPDLVEAIAHVLETAGPPDELERVLDGIARLSSQRPPDFERLVAPVRRRAERILAGLDERTRARFGGYLPLEVRVNIAALVAAWTSGTEPEFGPQWKIGLARFVAGRIAEVAHWAAAQTGEPMLAAPTYSGGWIEPAALVERLAGRLESGRTEESWFHLDLLQAMLRLLPRGRSEALAAARHLDGEPAMALRYALGDDVPIGPTAALWVAAARCRNPEGDDAAVEAAHPRLGSGGASAGVFAMVHHSGRIASAAIHADPPVDDFRLDMPTVMLAVSEAYSYSAAEGKALVDWLRFVWPQSRRSWFAAAALIMAQNIDWWEAQWPNRLRLEPLFEPWTTIGTEAALLIAVTLQAKDPGERGLAVEAATALLADGRLTVQAVEGAYSNLADLTGAEAVSKYPHRMLKPQRFAVSMGQIASASPAHALACQDIAAQTLDSFVTARGPVFVPVGQLAPILRLMVELAAQTGRPTPAVAGPSLERLAAGKGDTAKLADQLLGM
jgi:hypothetical protein